MSTDELAFAAVVTLAAIVGFAFLVNPKAAVAGGLSQPRATLRAEGHAELLIACCAVLPWAALGSLYLLAARASLALGHWPTPMINDPKSFGWSLHYAGTWFLGNAALVSAMAVFGLLFVLAWRDVRPSHGRVWFLVFASGYTLLWLQITADPGRLFEWFID